MCHKCRIPACQPSEHRGERDKLLVPDLLPAAGEEEDFDYDYDYDYDYDQVKRRSAEIGSSSPLARRKQEGSGLDPGGGGNLQPVILLASLDKSILQIRWER